MLTKTTESAVKALMYIGTYDGTEPLTPKLIAQYFDASPSYMAKIIGQLVKSNILKAFRGAKGGVSLSRGPEKINLLEIVEATQGKLIGAFCPDFKNPQKFCSFHQTMCEIYDLVYKHLAQKTLADLLKDPQVDPSNPNIVLCQDCYFQTD